MAIDTMFSALAEINRLWSSVVLMMLYVLRASGDKPVLVLPFDDVD